MKPSLGEAIFVAIDVRLRPGGVHGHGGKGDAS